MGQYQGRFLYAFDDIGDCKGFPGPGYTEKYLGRCPCFDSGAKLFDSRWLVAGRAIIGSEFELHGKI